MGLAKVAAGVAIGASITAIALVLSVVPVLFADIAGLEADIESGIREFKVGPASFPT